MTTLVKVKVGAVKLMKFWYVLCEPPYFYLRCRICDQREFLPWDPRMRTAEAHELLLQHGKQCADAVDEVA
jgi:hypothetical protein